MVVDEAWRVACDAGCLDPAAQEPAGREVQEFRSGTKGMLRIAGPPFFTDGVISRLLPSFRDRHGSVSFTVSYGYGGELKDAVRHGWVDLFLVPWAKSRRNSSVFRSSRRTMSSHAGQGTRF